jgi:hypothetical protein
MRGAIEQPPQEQVEAARDEELGGYPPLVDIKAKEEPGSEKRSQPEAANGDGAGFHMLHGDD